MSTTPSSPLGSTGQFPKLSEIVGYIKHHEKLIALALLLIVGWFSYGKLVDYLDRRDVRNAAVETEKLREQVARNAELAAQNAKLAEDYKALAAQVLAQNTALQQAIAARDTATKKQQDSDRALPPDALAGRWQQLVNLPSLSVQPTTTGNFTVTPQAATETVVQLEELPRLQSDLKDTQTQSDNYKQQSVKAEAVIAGLRTEIEGKQAEIVQSGKACDAKLAEVKAGARKAKRNWFIRGLIVGAGIAGYILR